MNKRIEELTNEALGIYLKYPWSTMDYNDIDIFSKRFAKLIIQDFIDICNAEKNNYSKDRQASYDWEDKNIYAEGEAACASIKHQVKQRFEVEE